MKRFAIIGAAGFIAPRHVAAIKEIGGCVVAACDHHDTVGYLDRYFPNADFYTRDTEFFSAIRDRVDCTVVCTPNDKHFLHAAAGLVVGDVILEKPPCLELQQVLRLLEYADRYKRNCWAMLQLRHDRRLRQYHEKNQDGSKIEIRWVTPRGPWYWRSWKGNSARSGGLLKNIAIHELDVACWFGGPLREIHSVKLSESECAASFLLDKRRVEIHVSLRGKPEKCIKIGRRKFLFDHDKIPNLHLQAYRDILAGDGTPLVETVMSMSLAEDLQREAVHTHPVVPEAS